MVPRGQAGADWSDGGQPRPLPRTGAAPSFEALAQAVRRDVHPRTMLDTLVSAGTVTLSDDGQTVALVQTSYQPLAGSDDQLAYLSRNLGDHAQAAFENVQGRDLPHFERAVHYSGPVSYTHLRAHETVLDLVCRLLLEKKKIAAYTSVGRIPAYAGVLC